MAPTTLSTRCAFESKAASDAAAHSTKSLIETGRSPLFGSIVKLFGWTGALPAGLNAGFLTFAPLPLRVTFAPYKYIDR